MLRRISDQVFLGLLFAILVGAAFTVNSDESAYSPLTFPLSGNRTTAGRGTFPNVETYAFPTGKDLLWLDSLTHESGVVLRYVARDESRLFGVTIDRSADQAEPLTEPDDPELPDDLSGALALLFASQHSDFPLYDAAPEAIPMPVEDALLYIARNGDLVLRRAGQQVARLAINAMRDARPVISASGLIAVYVNPTERYAHNVLGNPIEAAALLLVAYERDSLRPVMRIDLAEPEVFEGLSPFWADLDEDGFAELVTTVSSQSGGARLVIYRADGTILAQSPAIGQAYRWRHQVAFGPFGPNGEMELVEVQTPHIGGIVQFWRYDPQRSQLVLAARVPGYTSHRIGSANLDQALAGDFNGDGIPEIVLTNQSRDTVFGLQRFENGAFAAWSFPLDAAPVTNFAAFHQDPHGLALVFGQANGIIRIWRSAQTE